MRSYVILTSFGLIGLSRDGRAIHGGLLSVGKTEIKKLTSSDGEERQEAFHILELVTPKVKRKAYIQLGLLVDGLAVTIPGLAPGALEPLGPMLLSTPCKATGLSAAMKPVREPVARLSRRCGLAGRARHADSARLATQSNFAGKTWRNIMKASIVEKSGREQQARQRFCAI